MYSESHYLARSILAMELSEMPENIRRKKAYVALALNWKKMADKAAKAAKMPRQHSG
jgi:hypothetical protein